MDAVAVVASPQYFSMSIYRYVVQLQCISRTNAYLLLYIRAELCSFVTIPYKSLWQSENLCKHLKITWKFVFECALFVSEPTTVCGAVDIHRHILKLALRVMYLSSYSFRFMPILANLFWRGSYATRHTILLFIIWIC